jgi:phosphodiesterase/alkaline phosphatase D-like protein
MNRIKTKVFTLAAGLTLTVTAVQAQAPIITESWSWSIGSTSAGMSASVDNHNTVTSATFKVSTNADLSGAMVNTQNVSAASNGIHFHWQVNSLRPATKYYWQASVTNAKGSAVGTVYSFTTGAAAAPTAGTGSFVNVTPTSVRYTIHFDPKGSTPTVSLTYGTDPNLAGAQPKPLDLGLTSISTNAAGSLERLKADTKYYYQVNISTASGSAKGAIGSFATRSAGLPAPLITRVWSFNVGKTSVGMSSTSTNASVVTTGTYKFSTHADMSGAQAYSQQINATGGPIDFHHEFTGLQPNTTYYWTSTVTNVNGTATSAVQSFKTQP